MADYTLAADQHAVHEIALSPGTAVTVSVSTTGPTSTAAVQVFHLSGDKPVYIRGGNTVTVRDGNADVVVPGTWLDFADGIVYRNGSNLALISEEAAIVSVVRS